MVQEVATTAIITTAVMGKYVKMGNQYAYNECN